MIVRIEVFACACIVLPYRDALRMVMLIMHMIPGEHQL